MATNIFVNLPVKDLKRSMEFFGKLGFTFNKQFTDETAACMVVSDNIFVMLLTHEKFGEFTPFTALYTGDSAFFPAQTSQPFTVAPRPFPIPTAPAAIDSASNKIKLNLPSITSTFIASIPSLVSSSIGATLPPAAKQFYEFHLPPTLDPSDSLAIFTALAASPSPSPAGPTPDPIPQMQSAVTSADPH